MRGGAAPFDTPDYEGHQQSIAQISARAWVRYLRKEIADPSAVSPDDLYNAASQSLVLAGRESLEIESRETVSRLVLQRTEKTQNVRSATIDVLRYCKSVAEDPKETRDFEEWVKDQNNCPPTGEEVEESAEQGAKSSGSDDTIKGKSDHCDPV